VSDDAHYLHGSDPGEQTRLELMNELLNEQALREMRLGTGDFVLDLGCGTAIFAREMAAAVGPEGRVLGIERDRGQIAKAVRLADGDDVRVEVREGDARRPPLRDAEWGTFDVVHARFLLEHLPDPGTAVHAMLRAARPGGRVFLADDDHAVFRVTPEPRGFAELWAEYMRVFERNGNDPRVGRRLVALLHGAGAEELRNGIFFFGSCAGSPTFPAAANNLLGVLDGARRDLLEGGVTPDRLEYALDGLRAWARRADAALWYGADWAEGKRRS